MTTDANPFVGTWKLNYEASNLKLYGSPPTENALLTYQEIGPSIRFINSFDVSGDHQLWSFTAKYDEEEVGMISSKGPVPNRVRLRRIDGHTQEQKRYAHGKHIVTGVEVVSEDGRMLTRTRTGETADGDPFHVVEVYDRQP